jgi:hypothetical protein
MSLFRNQAIWLVVFLGFSQTAFSQQATAVAPQKKQVKTDRQLIDRYRVNQQRARDLTSDLLAILVDTQMLQLEDNRLTDLPLYEDLKTMRGRMQELARSKMPDVIELLVQADAADTKDRKAIMNDVHVRMRQVLRDLLRERERLRLRRQQAELIERIGEIVLKQRSTLQASLTLTTAQEQLVLTTIDAQKNVGVLVATFHETLNLVSDWPGELGALAKTCSDVLTANKIDLLLVQVESQLNSTEFTKAVATEKEIITVLESILLQIRRFEDPAWIDSDAAEAADRIISAQEELKTKVEDSDPEDSQQVDALVQEQTVIREKLQRLEALVAGNPEASELLQRAEEAASEARQEIFDGQIEDAVEKQEEIIGALAELQDELESPTNLLDPDLTSEEYEQIADALAEVGEKLVQADQLNDDAAEQLDSEDNAAATAAELEANETVDEAAAEENVIDAVKSAIQDAAMATEEAGEALKESQGKESDDPAQATAEEAIADAGDEIKEAIGRAQEAEDEARRNALATKLGELNRAVDALERAAAKARENADVIGDDNPPTPQETADVEQDFNTTSELAENVAEGIENISPEAVENLNNAAEQAKELADKLGENDADSDSRESDSQSADDIAAELENAADQIRKDVVDTAEELVNELKEQIASVNEIQEDLNQLAMNDAPPTTEQLEQLSDKTLQKLPDAGKALQNAAKASEDIESANEDATGEPGEEPAGEPGEEPAGEPGEEPAGEPGEEPAGEPGEEPAGEPGDEPAGEPGEEPAGEPGEEPAGEPGEEPAGEPGEPGEEPAGEPGEEPAGEPGDAETMRDRQVLQAEVIADIKEEKLLEDLLKAEQLALLAVQGEESAADLADLRNQAEQSEDSDAADPSDLLEAILAQAESLAGVGQLASEIAEQQNIANEPILDASELSRELTQPDETQLASNDLPANSPTGEQPVPGDTPAGEPGETPAGESGETPAGESGETPAGESGETPAGESGETPAGESGGQAAQPAPPLPPNDGFVPTNPLETAAMMAGAELELTAEALGAEELPFDGLAGDPGSPMPGTTPMPGSPPMPGSSPMPGQADPASGELADTPMPAASVAVGGEESKGKVGASENEGPEEGPVEVVEAKTDGDSRVPGGRGKDADVPVLGTQQSPWLTTLPKSVQQAIKSGNKRTLPRGYEDRLKRYFNSIK